MSHSEHVEGLILQIHESYNLDQRLSAHFTLREILFGTGDFLLNQLSEDKQIFFLESVINELDDEIVSNLKQVCAVLEIIRAYFDQPIFVTCGFRPRAWDVSKGRSGNSQHCDGKAADIRSNEIPLTDIFKFIEKTFLTGGRAINKPAQFVHFDTRFDNRYFWTY